MDSQTSVVVLPVMPPGQSAVSFRPFDTSGTFVLSAKNDEIRRLAVRGVGVTSLAQGFGVVIQIVSVLILARLLMPADFGVVAMVTTFSLLFMNFGGNGFTEAILQRKELDHWMATNLFWINVGAGLVLTGAFAAAGSLMAWFYHNPRVVNVAVGLSPTIFLTSASVLHLALLMRGMRFSVVYASQAAARLISVVVSILLAWAGWGYWALVGGAVAQPLCECIGAWIFCRWIPSRPGRVAGTGSMIQFALTVYGRFSFNYFARNVDNLLVGWRFNAQALGFYKKAYDLFAMSSIMQSFTPVAVSALSRLRHDSKQYKRYLLSALSIWAFLGMGVGGALTLCGKDLIRILLGPKWEPAGQIFTFFGPGFGITFVYGIHGWIHLSIGRPGRWFQWAIIEFVVTGLLFVLVLPWGPVAVAMSWSVSLSILTLPALWYAGRPIDLGLAPIAAAVWKFVLASLLSGFATASILGGFRLFVATSSVIDAGTRLAGICFLFCVFYMSAVTILHRSPKPILEVIELLGEMTPWGRSPKVPLGGAEAITAGQ